MKSENSRLITKIIMKDKMFKPQKELTSRQETTKSQNVCKRTEGKS